MYYVRTYVCVCALNLGNTTQHTAHHQAAPGGMLKDCGSPPSRSKNRAACGFTNLRSATGESGTLCHSPVSRACVPCQHSEESKRNTKEAAKDASQARTLSKAAYALKTDMSNFGDDDTGDNNNNNNSNTCLGSGAPVTASCSRPLEKLA